MTIEWSGVRCLVAVVITIALATHSSTVAGRPSESGAETASGIESSPPDRLMRADGSIDLAGGARGSVTSGPWCMELDTDGTPRFIRDIEDAAGRARPPAGAPGIPRAWEGVAPAGGESPGPSQAPDPADVNWDDRFVLPNGVDNAAGSIPMPVRACVVDGRGNVYVGGSFSAAGGVLAKDVAMWDGNRWFALGSGRKYPVSALAVDASGNLYAGGSASAAVPAVTKWDGTSWAELPGLRSSAYVNALTVDDEGNLYAGGQDTDPVTYENFALLVKWDGGSWTEVGSRIKGEILAIVVDASGSVFVGGNFRNAGGAAVQNIARWDGNAWTGLGSGMRGTVRALALDGTGNLYAGGTFNQAGGLSAECIAKWDGTNWSALESGLNSWAHTLAVDASGSVYAGGRFTSAGGVSARRIAKWDGARWSALGSGMDNWVDAMAADRFGHLWAAGSFESAGTPGANHVARWDGSNWWAPGSGIGAGLASPVYALASDRAGSVYAGGGFVSAGNVIVNHIAKWDGAEWSALGTGMEFGGFPPYVSCLVADGTGFLYAGGDFTTAGGIIANNVARWDGTSWSALGSGLNRDVYALAVDEAGNLYAGGNFAAAGGVSAANVARWDGTSWSAMGSGTSSPVMALAVDGAGNLYAGGLFSSAGGVSARNIAKWDGTSWSALGSGLDGLVRALAVDDAGILYAAGDFTTAGEVSAWGVAKWDGVRWSALGPEHRRVDALTLDGAGNVYIGDNRPPYKVAKWDGIRWSSLGSGMDYFVMALMLDRNGSLYAGGLFASAGGKVSSHIALWRERHTIAATAGPGGAIAPSGGVTVINGEDQSFAIAPDAGHHVADVRVDGNSIGPATEYTFTEVTGDHTIEASFCVGVAFELMPRDLNLQSKGRWVSGDLTLPAPYRASDVDVASIRLNDVVRVAADWPGGTGDCGSRLKLKFPRAEVEATLVPGDGVPVTIGGTVAGSCFRGAESIRAHAPESGPSRAGQTIAAESAEDLTGERAGDHSAGIGARDMESEPALALRPANPVTGPLTVRFRVPDASPAELAVFDISGRAVARREVGPGSPGWNEVDLGELPAGVYHVRLSQAGRSVTARVARLR